MQRIIVVALLGMAILSTGGTIWAGFTNQRDYISLSIAGTMFFLFLLLAIENMRPETKRMWLIASMVSVLWVMSQGWMIMY